MSGTERRIACPVCAAPMSWDPVDERWECAGVVQHCFVEEEDGGRRWLVLTASGSGEDAELFSRWPFPGEPGTPA